MHVGTFVAHVEPVIGAEHDDSYPRPFVLGDEIDDRGEPLAVGMHQGRARMRAVQHLVARIVNQDALQSAGDALRLAVAEDDNGLRRRIVIGPRTSGGATRYQQDDSRQLPGALPGSFQPTEHAPHAPPPQNQHAITPTQILSVAVAGCKRISGPRAPCDALSPCPLARPGADR